MKTTNIHVIIIDDTWHMRESLKVAMETAGGFEITGMAASAPEVAKLFDTGPVEVVLLDLELPNGEAFRMAKAIKKAYPHVVIVGLCVFSDPKLEAAAKSAGVSLLLEKAVSIKTFMEEIRNQVKHRMHQ